MTTKVTYHRDGTATYEVDGRVVIRSRYERACRAARRKAIKIGGSLPYVAPTYSDTHPGESLRMSCNSSEIDMMNKAVKDHGIVGVNYVPHRNRRGEIIGGEPIITNNSTRTGRRKWAQIFGRMTIGCPLRDEDGYD